MNDKVQSELQPKPSRTTAPVFPTFSVNYKQQTLSSLSVEVHSDHIGPLVRREKVITNNDIAIVDIDGNGNSVLVHDAPLLIISIF